MTTTDRAHIAMLNIAAPGHVNPGLPVIRELVSRGHRVTYAVPERFAEAVAATGAEPRTYRSPLPVDDSPEAWGEELIDHVEPFLENAVRTLPQLAEAYAGDEPDLLLYDSTVYPGPVLARRWRIPGVQLSTHHVAWDGWEEELHAPAFTELKASARGIAHYRRFREWLDGNGMPDVDPDALAGRPERCLVLLPEVMQPHADRVDRRRYTFTGSCGGAPRAEAGWTRPAGAERVVLVSLGSTFTRQPGFYRNCLAAFGGRPGVHLVLQIGRHVDEAELGPVPAGVEIRRWVPQQTILRQADLFVTHAGMGGCQEGLGSEVPMIAVPQAVDQFGNADMLVALGVARRLDTEEATAPALRAAEDALLGDPALPECWAEVRRRSADEGGAPQAADLVEAELRRPGADRPSGRSA